MPSGKDYTSRLREAIQRTLAGHARSFEDELRSLQTNIAAWLDESARRLDPGSDAEVQALQEILVEALSEAEQNSAQRRNEEMLFLAHFAHDMRGKETQEEILSALLDAAHRYAPRLALFVTRGKQFIGWSSRGFGASSAATIEAGTLAFADSPLLSGALEADGLTTVDDLLEEDRLKELLANGVAGPWHAFPMKAMGRPVAVLLAALVDGSSCDLEPLCVLMDLTGLCVENMALKILHEMKTAAPSPERPSSAYVAAETEAEAPAPAQSGNEPVEEIEPAAAVEASAAVSESVIAEPADQSALAETGEAVPERVVSEVPLMQEDVAPIVQETALLTEAAATVTDEDAPEEDAAEASAGEPAEVLRAGEEAPQGTEEAPVTDDAGLESQEPVRPAALREVQPLSEEEKLHADAKRFARLLASEIKLYNEQRVLEGRANRDIYVRLKRDIDRSRDMYEKRISPVVSRRVDYFHDEIIRVLGDNDPLTLGSDYPGPRVES